MESNQLCGRDGAAPPAPPGVNWGSDAFGSSADLTAFVPYRFYMKSDLLL